MGVYCGSPILQKEIKAAKDTLNQIINNAEYVNDFITLDPAQGTALDCKVKTLYTWTLSLFLVQRNRQIQNTREQADEGSCPVWA